MCDYMVKDLQITDYKPALEGRSIISLQMSDTFASYQDINAAIKMNPTAELLTNRGVINQVNCFQTLCQIYITFCHLVLSFS